MAGLPSKFKEYIERLEDNAKPDTNDKRYGDYVKYYNAFLSQFGKEKIYLVGSTGDGLKLRLNKFEGDADFLLCSGKLEIPVENLEECQGRNLRCYISVQATGLSPDMSIPLVDGKYLSADILREVSPQLFTILRAIFTVITRPSDGFVDRTSRIVTTRIPMKVGLVRAQFRDLKVDGNLLLPEPGTSRTSYNRDAQTTAHLRKRWREVTVHSSDMEMVKKLLKIFTIAKVPGSKGKNFGPLNEFADVVDGVMKRMPLDQLDEHIDDSEDRNEHVVYNNDLDEMDSGDKIRATYKEMKSKDFVPALRIKGSQKLKCMAKWYARMEKAFWPPKNVSEEIYYSDIFLVAREAPISPDKRKDFCLSFNLAETKLAKCLTTVQRRVYLILKAYLQGIIEKRYRDIGREMVLKTYYLKTVFFWVCEREEPRLWTDENILLAIQKVLDFLLSCLQEKRLSHYFTGDNLFISLDDKDRKILQKIVLELQSDPILSLEHIMQQDSCTRGEIWLTHEEVSCIQTMKDDGGRSQNMDGFEDALIDLQRGFNESQRDRHGRAPIKEAFLKTLDVFLEDEKQKELAKRISEMSAEGGDAQGSLQHNAQSKSKANIRRIVNFIGNIVTLGGSQSFNSRQAGAMLHLIVGIGSFVKGVSGFVNHIGGVDGLRIILQQVTSEDSVIQHGVEMRNAFERYLSCPESEEEAVFLELKQRVAVYFIGRKE